MQNYNGPPILVHLASGIGNIVFATPLLRVLSAAEAVVDLLIDCDYNGVGELFDNWISLRTVYDERSQRPNLESYETVLAAIPPFYWCRFAFQYTRCRVVPRRPPDILFYQNEQAYYLEFARQLGLSVQNPPHYFVPLGEKQGASRDQTIVLAPGSKPGAMAAKRWPYFVDLAGQFADVIVVGTENDLLNYDGTPMIFPAHVRVIVERRHLSAVVPTLARAGMIVSNDCGLGHLAGALGTPTLLLFGPTPSETLGPLPPNVTVLRSDVQCQPCWFAGRLRACNNRIECLRQLNVDFVKKTMLAILSDAV